MYLPAPQHVLTAGLALTTTTNPLTPTTRAKGTVLDYAVEKCVDPDDGRARCTKPFLVSRAACYALAWRTEGALTHTTAEVRDAASGEVVYYRDTDGEWEPGKGELVYLDFKPKIVGTGNSTVHYEVKTCK